MNRFGPGLVVYWRDFVELLPEITPADILVASALPTEWVLPDSTTVCRLSDIAGSTSGGGGGGGGGGATGSSAV